MTMSTAPSNAPDALRLVGALILLVRALEQRMRARSCEGGEALTLTELGLLGQIERGVDQPSLVARALRLDPARITHVTDRLAAQSYIARAVDPIDRRRWRLSLTEKGGQRLQEGRADLRAAMETLLDGLSPQERTGLTDGLEGVRRVLGTTP